MSESETKKPDEFPAGVRVLAVDDDFVVLRTVERLLIKCGYKVTVAHHALEALQLLRANKEGYDLVISDVNMPDMDGFKLLEIVGLEMDLPVIMLSVDCDVKSVMKGIMHGAVDYLVKPVRLEELQLIWKHVAKRSFNKRKDCNEHGNKLDNSRPKDVRENHHAKKCKERSRHDKTEEDSEDSDEEMASHKKPRVNWTAELHAKFINAVNRLGVDRAVPKKILDIMNVPGLTRENVASHLQKYRKGLKKNATGHGQHDFSSSGTSASNASSFLVNRSGVNVHKSVSLPPSCFPVHQPYGSHARLSSTWLPRPLSRPINLCRQYATCSQASLSSTQHQGFTTGSEPTQILSNHLSYADRSNKLNCYEWRPCQDPWSNVGDSGSNSITQLGFCLDHQATDMFSSNYLLDDHFTNEFDLILEGDQNQLSSCPVLDAENEAHTNQDILDIQGTIFEDHRESSPSDFTINPAEHFSTETTFAFNLGEDVDDLHAALKQFQR